MWVGLVQRGEDVGDHAFGGVGRGGNGGSGELVEGWWVEDVPPFLNATRINANISISGEPHYLDSVEEVPNNSQNGQDERP